MKKRDSSLALCPCGAMAPYMHNGACDAPPTESDERRERNREKAEEFEKTSRETASISVSWRPPALPAQPRRV